ncbi:fused signal recognition particle receptor [Tahibacter aquaticus]|uniref:Signal recognition particle receptor FtsY n=1 Tax=Tahibacter aquaticus TaxID=520092 RepID=A0A4R6YRF5_9GAMM|nr:signal recognition particle-docking protein FtsY [Tahibacter aquaticus]TDR40459.1 fused signal recognition particle receptor [Tahibacter aquaticus]
MFKFWKKKPKPEETPVPATLATQTSLAEALSAAADNAQLSEIATLPEAGAVASAPAEFAAVEPAAPAAVEPVPAAVTPPPLPPLEEETPPAAETSAPARRSWRERLSGSAFARSLGTLFSRKPKLDEDLLEELETALITADVGISASTELVESLRKRLNRREFADADQLLAALRQALIALVQPIAQPLVMATQHKPFVVLMVGVNGVGKTTTIGKLARRYQQQGLDVMLAAGDTFRAAAVEQLKTWGERNRVPVVSQGSGSDAASVIFDALQSARSKNLDLLIADTAGRLHTQTGLMDELGKIRRVLGKIDAGAPHEVLLVIDGTTGQNAINQVRQFRAAIGVTGLVVTKLDGTAKGGVIFALAKEFGLPVRFVGLGESLDDLREFDATAFVDGLLPGAIGA